MSSSFPNCVQPIMPCLNSPAATKSTFRDSGACGCACAEFRRKFIGLIGFGLVCCPIRDTSTQGATQLGESQKISSEKNTEELCFYQTISPNSERARGDVLEV